MRNKGTTVRELLVEKGKVSREDREWLLQSLLRVGRGDLILNSHRPIPTLDLRKYRKWLKERSLGKPLQYVVGEADFRGLLLTVSKDVLIPRPETEVLVQLALSCGDALGEGVKALDVGTGSGAIALALKIERPGWEVQASDVSSAVLSVARKNAKRLELSVSFVKSDLMRKFKGCSYDLIVSNPPYVNPGRDKVAKDVHQYEPHLALYPRTSDRQKGLRERGAWCAEKIIESVASGEVKCRYMVLELSPRVASILERRWKKNSYVEKIWREKDLAGRARFLLIAWRPHG